MLLNRYQQLFTSLSTSSDHLEQNTKDAEDQLLRYVVPFTIGNVAEQYPDQQQAQRTKCLLKYVREIEESLKTCRILTDISQERVTKLINENININSNNMMNGKKIPDKLTTSDNVSLLGAATEVRKSLKRSNDLISVALSKMDVTPFSVLDNVITGAVVSRAQEHDTLTYLLMEGERNINNNIRKNLIEAVLDNYIDADKATLESNIPHQSHKSLPPFSLKEKMQQHITEQKSKISEIKLEIQKKKAKAREIRSSHDLLISDKVTLQQAHEEIDRIMNKRLNDVDYEFTSKTKGIVEQYSNMLRPLQSELQELNESYNTITIEQCEMDEEVKNLKIQYESQRLDFVEEIHVLEKQIADLTETPELVNFGLMASGIPEDIKNAFKKVLATYRGPSHTITEGSGAELQESHFVLLQDINTKQYAVVQVSQDCSVGEELSHSGGTSVKTFYLRCPHGVEVSMYPN